MCAAEVLPDAAGQRETELMRLATTLRRLLDESGDPAPLKDFDLDAWLAEWLGEPLPELGDRAPAELLSNPEGLRAVEQVLERMRGGLAA